MKTPPSISFLRPQCQRWCAAALLFVSSSAMAQTTATWQRNSADTWLWNDAGSWSPSIPGAGDTAVFVNRTGTQAVTVDTDRSILNITFDANSNVYGLSGGNFLLGNGGVIRTFGAGSGHTDTIETPIAIQGNNGTASFTGGSSTATRLLVLSGAVSGTSIAGGTTVLTLNGTNTGNNNVSGIISNGSGGGNLRVVKSEAGTWNLGAAGANTFTGGLHINQGTLITNNATSLGGTGNTIHLGNGDVTSLLRIGVGTSSASEYNVIVRSSNSALATRTINSAVSATRDLVANVQIGDGSGSVNTLHLGNNIWITGIISQGASPANLVVSASTEARLRGNANNTYTGSTTLQNGLLILAKTGAGSVTAIPGDLNIGEALNVANATVRQDGSAGNGGNQLAATTVINFLGAGQNRYQISNSFNTSLTFAGLNSAAGIDAVMGASASDSNTHSLNIQGSGTYSFAGIIRNSIDGSATSRVISLSKSGSGRQILAGANAYTGATTVSAGILEIATGGTIASSASTVSGTGTLLLSGGTAGTVTVNSGGTLAGIGTVGATNINSNGTLSIGASPGTMIFEGDLTLASGSISNFEIDGLTSGLYDLASGAAFDVTFDGTLNLLFASGFNTPGSVKIFDFADYDGSFSAINITGLAPTATATFNELTGIVNITVIPEPGTGGMVLLGLGLWALRRLRSGSMVR